MPLISVIVAIAILLVLVLALKLDAFFALILTAFVVGLMNGMDVIAVLLSLIKGTGSTLGNVALVLVFGAMLGRLVGESGAARAIAEWLVGISGKRHMQLAMAATGILVGMPMLYNAGFLVVIPLLYSVAATTGLPLVSLGLPLASGLSVTHGFLPPHPAPTFMAFVYGANMSQTHALGMVVMIPAVLVGGVYVTRMLTRLRVAQGSPPATLNEDHPIDPAHLPGVGISIFTILVPVFLMLAGGLSDALTNTTGIDPFRPDYDFRAGLATAVPDPEMRALVIGMKFIGNANVALFLSVFVALYTLGIKRGRTMPQLMDSLRLGVAGVATILMLIAAGGAFSMVLRDAGVGNYVAQRAAGMDLNPLLLAFGLASLMRLAVGSATVAGMTTAGLVAPMVLTSGVSPELMVLATGAGSLMFSHFNDTGFWMFKEYFNLTIPQTFATWSVMEMAVALVGMAAVLALHALG